MQVQRWTAFSEDPAGGNPAGVVLDAAAATVAQMQQVAADVGFSETAFVTGERDEGLHVRYFSPLAEVPFCGHATIATAVALADRDGPGRRTFWTAAGRVDVECEERDDLLVATLTSVEPEASTLSTADLAEVVAALGWSAEDLDPDLPPRVA